MSDTTTSPTTDASDALVAQARDAVGADNPDKSAKKTTDELQESDQLATTLSSLQNVIERNATELERVSEELKHLKEELRNVFENDSTLSEAEEQVKQFSNELKQRKTQIMSGPQVTTIKVKLGELQEQRKEIEEALSNHLVNYHQLTGSTSFDTSDGDQWEFNIHAKVKTRKK